MGDFNDKLNEFGTLEITVDGKPFLVNDEPLVISHGTAPVSCCYNWNSASYIANPKPLSELKLNDNNAYMSLHRKECIEEMSQLYETFDLKVPGKLLKSVGSQDYLFGMPLMREQGNLLNYLFTGDYCFSKGNANPIKIFRKIEVPNITFPEEMPSYERYNYLLHVYRNTDPLTRKKIYYSLNMDSKESDHEMVYLDTTLPNPATVPDPVSSPRTLVISGIPSGKGLGTAFGGYSRKRGKTKKRLLKSRKRR
jgi:hypothetical protein